MMIYQAKNLAFTYKILFISELGESIKEKKMLSIAAFFPNFEIKRTCKVLG